jgi:phytol kinase
MCSGGAWAPVIAATVPGLNGLRLALVGSGVLPGPGLVSSVSRSSDRSELLRGPLIYVVVLMVATLLTWRHSMHGLCAVAMMCGGDGAADLVGRRLGQTYKLPWNPGKSWAGSLAMFCGGAALTWGCSPSFPCVQ